MSILIILGACTGLSAQITTALTDCNDVVICNRIQEPEQPKLTLHLKPKNISTDITSTSNYELSDIQELPPWGNDPPIIKNKLIIQTPPHCFGLCNRW
ncbi:hypothetical protein [uncultured Psychrosphaera sp.]|uniref:hypothetical protein n=1 Tax=uncultured Psychrosphaera sp. TaxID=1403522 RepID=UPI00261CE6F3|nr:hypothetical protein [uncultured Psychrosphaera sp.]